MPQLSQRAYSMPASPIRKLAPYADRAKEAGRKVYHLNIGQPDIPTPQTMLNYFRNLSLKVIAYSPSGGLWEYREKLTEYYRRFDIALSKEDILVTTGGSEAIIFAMMVTMNPGDEIIIPEPFYTNYNGFAVEAGVRVVPVTCRAEDGFRLPSIEKIREKITERTRAILICNPNNPTGYVYSWEELEQLRQLVADHDLFLIADEVYREFVYDDATFHSALHLKGIEERVVVVDSVSKRYSACGARVGCLVSRNRELLEAALKLGQARLSPPTLEQLAAMAAIDTPESYIQQAREEYRRRRDVVFQALQQVPGVVGLKPKGAFYTIVGLPVDDAEKFCIWMLESFHDQNETVMLAPASGFYATPGLGKREVRIAFVLNVQAMQRAMALLQKALREYPGRL